MQIVRHSEGVSYHDGPSNRSKVIREDTGFLDSNFYKINSTGNSMFISYYSTIEQPRVYGFLLHFHCIPAITTILKRKLLPIVDSSDQDCFMEDNTIESRSTKPYRSWKIPGSGDRHYKKKPDYEGHFNKLPHQAALKKSRDQSVTNRFKNPDKMDMDFYTELDLTMIFSPSVKAYRMRKDLLLLRSIKKPGSIPRDLAYNDSKEFQSIKDKTWFKQSNDFVPLHPILALYENRNSIIRRAKSKNQPKILRLEKGPKLNNFYSRNVVKMATKKTSYHQDYSNLENGHEHQDLLKPRPDLTIMVQPSKIDYAGWQNNGGVRFFIHRTYSVPIDPRDSVEVSNNVEAFINLEYDDIDLLSGEFQRDRSCMRRFTRKNLWYDLEVELYNPFTYTWDSCIHEWQAKTMFRACKCLPHYYSELFDYWWNKNLRCNHHGLKCMALVNGKSIFSKKIQILLCICTLGTAYMFNSTWGSTHKPIPLHCPSMCGHRQFNATTISQSRLKNDSWYIQWLRSKGNRLFDLENQITRYLFNGSVHDYALMQDHKRHLMNDTSVLHFYFGKLRSERKKAADPPATPSIDLTFQT